MSAPREEIKEELREDLEQEMEIVKSPTPVKVDTKEERLYELNADLVQPKTPNQRPPKYSQINLQSRGRAKYRGTIT